MKLEQLSYIFQQRPTESLQGNISFAKDMYHQALGILGLDQSSLIKAADQAASHYQDQAVQIQRWSHYNSAIQETDNNVAAHQYRQALITMLAIHHDDPVLGLTEVEKEVMVAGATIHDFGEMDPAIKDVAWNIKNATPETRDHYERLEIVSAFKFIDQAPVPSVEKRRLKEVMWKIPSGLDDSEYQGLFGAPLPKSEFPSEVGWEKLNGYFGTHEHYGYTFTGTQQTELAKSGIDLTGEEYWRIMTWGTDKINASKLMKSSQGSPIFLSPDAERLLEYKVAAKLSFTEALKEGLPSAWVLKDYMEGVLINQQHRLALRIDLRDLSEGLRPALELRQV